MIQVIIFLFLLYLAYDYFIVSKGRTLMGADLNLEEVQEGLKKVEILKEVEWFQSPHEHIPHAKRGASTAIENASIYLYEFENGKRAQEAKDSQWIAGEKFSKEVTLQTKKGAIGSAPFGKGTQRHLFAHRNILMLIVSDDPETVHQISQSLLAL